MMSPLCKAFLKNFVPPIIYSLKCLFCMQQPSIQMKWSPPDNDDKCIGDVLISLSPDGSKHYTGKIFVFL